MNLKINTLPFKANYSINGKQTAKQTSFVYETEQKRLKKNGKIATQSQEYLESPHIQKAIDYLPKDTFVRLNTGILDKQTNGVDEILGFTPFISFETKSINEQIEIYRTLGENGDSLSLSLDENGELNKKEIDNWFANLLSFYYSKK